MMAFTGCRISEALSLTRESVDFEAKAVIVKSLKKRGKMIYRAIPLPPKFLTTLGSGLTDHSQKSTVAASASAEK